jgi:hypothetical protein
VLSPSTMTVGLGLALASIVSIGPSEGPRLEWDAPLECPDQRWVEERVGAYLGYPLSEADDVHVVAHAHAQAAGFVLDLTTQVGSGPDGVWEHQRLEHHECVALVELAASLAAISIDPLAQGWVRAPTVPVGLEVQRAPAPSKPGAEAAVRPVVQTPSRPAPKPAPPEKVVPPQTEPLVVDLHAGPSLDDRDLPEPGSDLEPPNRRTRLTIGASAGLALELFPNPAPEVHGHFAISRGRGRVAFRGELLGGAILAGRFRSADASAGGDLMAWDLGLRPCGVPRWDFVELRICAALGGGQIRARGVNVEPALQRAHPWLWVTPELGVAIGVTRRVALVLDLGATFHLYRPRFSISTPDAEFVTPVASARGRFGFEVRFL